MQVKYSASSVDLLRSCERAWFYRYFGKKIIFAPYKIERAFVTIGLCLANFLTSILRTHFRDNISTDYLKL